MILVVLQKNNRPLQNKEVHVFIYHNCPICSTKMPITQELEFPLSVSKQIDRQTAQLHCLPPDIVTFYPSIIIIIPKLMYYMSICPADQCLGLYNLSLLILLKSEIQDSSIIFHGCTGRFKSGQGRKSQSPVFSCSGSYNNMPFLMI